MQQDIPTKPVNTLLLIKCIWNILVSGPHQFSVPPAGCVHKQNIVACRPFDRQHIPNTHQWTNWEAVFSARCVRQLCGATIEELLGDVFSVRSVPSC
jgi:hypothetical protein